MEEAIKKLERWDKKYCEEKQKDEHWNIEDTFAKNDGSFTELIKSKYDQEFHDRVKAKIIKARKERDDFKYCKSDVEGMPYYWIDIPNDYKVIDTLEVVTHYEPDEEITKQLNNDFIKNLGDEIREKINNKKITIHKEYIHDDLYFCWADTTEDDYNNVMASLEVNNTVYAEYVNKNIDHEFLKELNEKLKKL